MATQCARAGPGVFVAAVVPASPAPPAGATSSSLLQSRLLSLALPASQSWLLGPEERNNRVPVSLGRAAVPVPRSVAGAVFKLEQAAATRRGRGHQVEAVSGVRARESPEKETGAREDERDVSGGGRNKMAGTATRDSE